MNHDVGAWWDVLSADGGHQLVNLSSNFGWWTRVCSSEVLAPFRSAAGLESAQAYLQAAAGLDREIAKLNAGQDEFVVSLALGPRVRGVDYDDSASIIAFASQPGHLAHTIAVSLQDAPALDVALLRVTSAFDLLTAAITAQVLRARQPGVHISLIDHGYENFSLKPHLAVLMATGALAQVFDSIVCDKDEIDEAVIRLIAQLDAGAPVKGFIRLQDLPAATARTMSQGEAPPLTPIFSPEPVLQLRLSPAGCYWGRCAYCTQNAKYSSHGAPSKAAIATALDRVEAYRRQGCRVFIFSDEAVSPAMLRALSEEVIRRGLDIAWTCRCKLERAFDEPLIALTAQAGCREILFGLETTSPDLLRRMDKYVVGQTDEDVAKIFCRMARAGVGIHVNLINGFPGETLDEAWETAGFVARTLRDHPNATFGLNPFTVFPDTPISASPERFGISELQAGGDMPSAYRHRLDAPTRRRTAPVVAALNHLTAAMEHSLGWDALTAKPGGRTAFELYSTTGHGVVMKCAQVNPIDVARALPVSPSPGRPKPRRRAFLTGATGVVGAAVLAKLQAKDWEVLALTRDPAGSAPLACPTLTGDLYDLPDLDDALAGMDAVIHCASPRSLDRRDMLVGEVDATACLLDAWSTGAFVYASSQTVYGLPTRVLSETDPVAPDNWYDLAKITNEHQVGFTARALGGVGVSLRIPLVLSASHRPGAGNYLIDLYAALKCGDDLLFDSQAAMAEHGSVYIEDDDLGAAMAAAAEMSTSGVFNLAGGFVTWRRLIETLADLAGLEPRWTISEAAEPRPGAFVLPRSRTEYDVSRFEAASPFRPAARLDDILSAFVAAERRPTVPAKAREIHPQT